MRHFISFFILTFYAFGFEYHLEPYKINENIQCFFGLHGKAEIKNGGRVLNTCFIETSEGYVVIDSGPTYSYAQQAYQVMQSQKLLPVKYVINTSDQEINILGNEFYREQGAILIGPQSYEKRIEKQENPTLLEQISNKIFINTRFVPLDIYLNTDKNITIGNIKLEIKKFEKKESRNLVVYLENQQTIFVGNFVTSDRLPSIKDHYSLKEWMSILQKIEKMPWEYLVSSHGVKGTKNALLSTKKYLSQLKQNIIKAIKNNHPETEALQEVKLEEYSQVDFYNDFHKDNIKQAYLEYKELVDSEILTDDEKIILESISSIETQRVLSEQSPQENREIVNPQIEKKEIQEEERQTIVKEMLNASITEETTPIYVPNIEYKSFYQAKKEALKEHKYILIKIEANHCKPCEQLNNTLETNNHLKKMINEHIIAVKINTDAQDEMPLGLTNRGTPTVFLIEPESDKVLMKLEPEDVEELEASLNIFI